MLEIFLKPETAQKEMLDFTVRLCNYLLRVALQVYLIGAYSRSHAIDFCLHSAWGDVFINVILHHQIYGHEPSLVKIRFVKNPIEPLCKPLHECVTVGMAVSVVGLWYDRGTRRPGAEGSVQLWMDLYCWPVDRQDQGWGIPLALIIPMLTLFTVQHGS